MSQKPAVQGGARCDQQNSSPPELADPGMIAEGAPEPVELNSTPSISVCLADLENAKGPFSDAPVHCRLPCTAAEGQTCQIVRHLSTWNEFLFQVRMEIREVAGARGQLSVISFDYPELPDAGEGQMCRIATLLYWLLSTHHCVSSLSARPSRFKAYRWLFRDGLLKSSSVRILKLQFARFHVCKDVCKIIASAQHVEELELQSDGLSSTGVLSALSNLLKTTNSLAVLTIPHVSMSRHDADRFLTALAENKTLKELSMHESVLSEASMAGRATFKEYLKNNNTLTALVVGKGNEFWYHYSFVPTSLSLRWLLQGLLLNKTVSSLTLTHIVVDRESTRLICTLLTESRVLRRFSLTSSTTDLNFQPRPMYDCWIEALAENESLHELRLPFRFWEPGRWEVFLNILSRKKNLTSVSIGIDTPDYDSLPQICKCLRDSGTENRVSFGTFYASDSFDLLESKAFSEVSVLSFEDFTNVLRLLRRLPSFHHITSVRLDIWTGHIALSWAFADYVKSSSTLRNLRLWLGSDGASRDDANGWRAALFASLSRNTSIRVLHVTSMYMDEQDVCLLADSITSSRNIETVHVGTVTLAESGALVRRLSLGIATNYTLLSLSLDSPVDREAAKHLFTVCDVARRNSGLVALAAQFVTGARPGSVCAQALERVSNHPALLELLSESTSMSTEEAAATIRSRLRSIEGLQQFMRLAGVVKERVTCSAHEDGRMHLADLNEHCWSHVRRYLKLHDVVHDESMSDNV
ncbi:uncharacterized protein LOC142571010 [Dermacentor variabilis]|uniref:uncharacterized protein LOC142571010 n=1 Tax=Dermacentor variabilis TaxID=34621 RepID=UPI003F5B5AC5